MTQLNCGRAKGCQIFQIDEITALHDHSDTEYMRIWNAYTARR